MSATPGSTLTRLDLTLLRATRRALGRPRPCRPPGHCRSSASTRSAGWRWGWRLGLGPAAPGLDERGVGAVVAAPRLRCRAEAAGAPGAPGTPDVPALVASRSRLSFPSAHSCSTAAAAVGFAPMVGPAPMVAVTGAMLVSRVLLGCTGP